MSRSVFRGKSKGHMHTIKINQKRFALTVRSENCERAVDPEKIKKKPIVYEQAHYAIRTKSIQESNFKDMAAESKRKWF